MKESREPLLILLLLLIVAIFYGPTYFRTKFVKPAAQVMQNPRPAQTAPPTQATPPTASPAPTTAPAPAPAQAQTPATPNKKGAAIQLPKGTALQQSPDCKTTKAGLIEIREKQFKVLVRGKGAKPLIFERSIGCVEVGKEYPLTVYRGDRVTKLVYFRQVRGRLKITRLESIEPEAIAKIPGKLKDAPAAKPTGASLAVYGHWVQANDESEENFGVPRSHPSAQTIDAKSVAGMVAKGAVLLDVRPKKQFDQETIPGAKHATAKNYPYLVGRLLSPTAMKKLGTALEAADLPRAQRTSVIVFANSPVEYSSYNAVTLLALAGFDHIYWLRGGLDETHGLGEAPLDVKGVRTVSTRDAAVIAHSGGRFLDVRPKEEFAVRHLTDAVNVPLHQQLDERGFGKLRKRNLTANDLAHDGETMPISEAKLDQNTTYIIYGRNEYDWRPYKATILLKAAGYNRVFWFRYGLEAWARNNYFNPGRYKYFRDKNFKRPALPEDDEDSDEEMEESD